MEFLIYAICLNLVFFVLSLFIPWYWALGATYVFLQFAKSFAKTTAFDDY